MSGGLVFLAVLSILVIVHEFGHFWVARLFGVKVERFSIGFGPTLFTFRSSKTEYCVSAIPLGGYVKLAGEHPQEVQASMSKEEFLARSVGVRSAIILAGPGVNYLLGFLLFSSVFFLGNPQVTSRIGQVLPASPAQGAGLLPGDRIISLDGKSVLYWEEVTAGIRRKAGGTLQISIDRAGSIVAVEVTPAIRQMKNLFGQTIRQSQIGIAPAGEIVKIRYGFWESLAKGGQKLIDFTGVTFHSLWAILSGSLPVRESLTGPIGIFFVTQEAAKLGFVYLLQVMAFLSASLAIFNVLPIPVLDGGHLFFLLLEKIRRRPIAIRVQEMTHQVAVFLLISLVILIFYNDLVRFGILGKLLAIFKR